MNDKSHIITLLTDEFTRWEELVAGMSETQRTAPLLPDDWSIKDVLGHLRAWQQVSIARFEAARLNREPVMPSWLAGLDPESEEDTQDFNARIYEIYHAQPFAQVHQAWRDGFLRFLELGEAISEQDLFDTERYAWLNGYALAAVLEGSYEHHAEHRDTLLAALNQREI